MSLLKQLDKLLKNKFALYGVLFLAVSNVFGYLMTSNYEAIVFFTLVAYLSASFTKNNILVALIALVATNLLLTVVQGRRIYEGFKEGNNHETAKDGDASHDSSKGNKNKADGAKDDKENKVDVEATKKMNSEASAEAFDPAAMKDHMANLDRIEALLDKQEGLVGSLGKIESMMGRIENMGSMFKSKKANSS